MVKYCIYCGFDKEKGHHKDCPIVSGIPKAVLGIGPRENDTEFNLNLGRMSQLMTLRKNKDGKLDISSGDPKRDQRLAYEQAAFQIRRIIPVLAEAQEESKKKIIGVFARNKLKKINKQIDDIYKSAALYGVSKKRIDAIWNQKIMLANYSGKECIPFFRDSETDELIYLSVE